MQVWTRCVEFGRDGADAGEEEWRPAADECWGVPVWIEEEHVLRAVMEEDPEEMEHLFRAA